jgi:hypothetical protein
MILALLISLRLIDILILVGLEMAIISGMMGVINSVHGD